ncbi:MAG: shikimate dehydrogenase [Clostridiales bacterium]|nr:shikimate dehydrogenase [Clostridiales bacterium]
MKYGLIGEHLTHSYSCEIHAQIADYEYELHELAPSELGGFLTKREFNAINVTIPYKQDVIPYLDGISDTAKRIGAVNTIVNRGGKLYGDNTDFAGMLALAKHIGVDMKGKKVLILGTGGASKTGHALAEYMGAESVYYVSRSGKNGSITYEQAVSEHSDAQVIINATPVGMFPKQGGRPIDISVFPKLEGVLDAIYNPLRTNLILDAQERGIPAEGGLYMLSAQAVHAAAVFQDIPLDESLVDKAFKSVKNDKQNIVLIGMPSSGKTTVGRILAEKCGKELADTDEYIVKKIGMPIADFFAKHGEAEFRKIEKETVAGLASTGGKIIATGGGAVLDAENVRALKQNGVLVFLDRRPENLIATDDRPLASRRSALEKLYAERYDIYCAAAEVHIDANTTPGAEADAILKELTK